MVCSFSITFSLSPSSASLFACSRVAESRNPLPESERQAQQHYDYYVRETGYREDPMNVLAERFFGPEEFRRMLDLRIGMQQIRATRHA